MASVVNAVPVLISAVAVVSAASAQEAQSREVSTLNAVEVTGSRIKSADVVTHNPVVAITSEQIARSGLASIGDILSQLSSSGSGFNAQLNPSGNTGLPPDGSGSGAGSSQLNLRSLGTKRVLVLVDGLRWVNESSGSGVSNAVDMNTIPVGIIERIEILQDGASSLYGSDAISGVVNIITKKSQDGGAISIYTADHTRLSGGGNQQISLSYGGQNERSEWFVNAEFSNQDGVSSADWEQSAFPVPGTGIALGSTSGPFTRLIFNGQDTYGGLCPRGACNIVSNGTQGNGIANDFHRFNGTTDRFNHAPYGLLLNPLKRKSIFGQAKFQLSESVSGYVKMVYNNRQSENQAAPTNISFGTSFASSPYGSITRIDASNPYNPFGTTVIPVAGQMRLVSAGARHFKQDVDTRYFSAGLNGYFSLAGRDFNWDANYVDATNKASNELFGQYNAAKLMRALGPTSACTGSCVPFNLFGGQAGITPQMLDYIMFTGLDRSGQRLRDYTANVSGGLFDLPAGAVEFAAGYEHRMQSGYYSPNPVAVAGEVGGAGVSMPPISGNFNANEYYIELNLPLLAELPGFKALSLSAASRYSDYSNFGTTTNSKLGLRWQVFDDLTIRGNWAEGFRAPSLGELYATGAISGPTLRDPCSAATGGMLANCTALGIPPGYTQLNTQILTTTNGNQGLKPETSRSLTWGAMYSPQWAIQRRWSDKLDLSLGYYRIDVDGAIQAPDAQTVLLNCAASADPNSTDCARLQRDAFGNITQFIIALENLGTVHTTGVDFGLDWRLPATRAGQFGARVDGTYTMEYAASDISGKRQPERVGILVNDRSLPRLKATSVLSWRSPEKAWGLDWTMRYISRLRETCGSAQAFAVCDDPLLNRHWLGATTYHDVRATWKMPGDGNGLYFAAGINNVFGKEAPICLTCSLNGYDGSTYSLPGRMAYLSARIEF